MFFQNYSVRIVGGTEHPDGYVRIRHGQTYSISLRNHHNRVCDADVTIDGKSIGIFRIPTHATISLERPPNDTGRFTFYRLDSPEAAQVGLTNNDGLGLISVTFTPELVREPRPLSPSTTWTATPKNLTSTYYTGEVTNTSYHGATASFSSGTRSSDTVSTTSTAGGQSVGSVASAAPGGTGLSGHSNQYYVNALPITYDYSQQVTINLRLIAIDDAPRPLTANTTPVPPRI